MGKLLTGGRDLAYRGLIFIPQYCAIWLLVREYKDLNIAAVIKGLFPLMTGRAPPYKEALDWLQCVYTTDKTGDCVAPASTVLF